MGRFGYCRCRQINGKHHLMGAGKQGNNGHNSKLTAILWNAATRRIMWIWYKMISANFGWMNVGRHTDRHTGESKIQLWAWEFQVRGICRRWNCWVVPHKPSKGLWNDPNFDSLMKVQVSPSKIVRNVIQIVSEYSHSWVISYMTMVLSLVVISFEYTWLYHVISCYITINY